MHEQEERGQLPQYAYVCVQRIHSVDGHGGTKHDGRCLYIQKTDSTFGTHLPSLFVPQEFCDQRHTKHVVENDEIFRTHQIYV